MIESPYVIASRIAFLRSFVRLRKKLTVIGIIGHTQGVSKAINPPRKPAKKMNNQDVSVAETVVSPNAFNWSMTGVQRQRRRSARWSADWPVLCFVLVGNRGGSLQLGHFFHHFFSIRLHGCHIVLFDFRFFDHCFGGCHLYILFVERKTDAIGGQTSLVVASHKFHFTFGFELGRVSHF